MRTERSDYKGPFLGYYERLKHMKLKKSYTTPAKEEENEQIENATPSINQYSRALAERVYDEREKVEDRLLRKGKQYKDKKSERLHSKIQEDGIPSFKPQINEYKRKVYKGSEMREREGPVSSSKDIMSKNLSNSEQEVIGITSEPA